VGSNTGLLIEGQAINCLSLDTALGDYQTVNLISVFRPAGATIIPTSAMSSQYRSVKFV